MVKLTEISLLEKVVVPATRGKFLEDRSETIKMIDRAMKALKAMQGKPIIWRGFAAGKGFGIAEVLNDRDKKFRGKALSQNKFVDMLFDAVGIKNPTFGSFDKTKTLLFGGGKAAKIYIPEKPFRVWQSEVVNDVIVTAGMSPAELGIGPETSPIGRLEGPELDRVVKDLAQTYENSLDRISEFGEVIGDSRAYFLVDPRGVFAATEVLQLFQLRPQISNLSQLKKTPDVIKLLEDFRSAQILQADQAEQRKKKFKQKN